jgi:hypothetical protein
MLSICAIGDLHCGSHVGLFPPDFVDRAGSPIGQNVVQSYLWECWQHYCKRAWATPCKAVVVNGDVIDGKQAKSGGIGAMPDLSDQRKAAVTCLEYLMGGFTEKPALYFVRGTPYHVGNDGDDEESIAGMLHAEEYEGEGIGFRARAVLNLQVGQTLIHFAHHVAYSSVNAVTPLGREIGRALKRAYAGAPMPDLLVRSHVHQYGVATIGACQAVSLPCWQMPGSHIYKNNAHPLVDIGGAIIWVDPQVKGATVECRPYPLPSLAHPVHALSL